MNTKNRNSAFPFRRSGGGKKRPNKSNPKGRGGGGHNYRSLPGNIGDLMSVMPSATKAVAQLISGNSRPSGQVVNARNVLSRAQKAIDDRLTDRLQPAIKDDFLEQVALLRLTLADAASLEDDQDEFEAEAAPEPAEAISMDKLRALALSIAGNAQTPEPVQQPSDPIYEDDDEGFDHDALAAATAGLKASAKPAAAGKTAPSSRGLNNTSDKLRLKAMLEERRNSGEDE